MGRESLKGLFPRTSLQIKGDVGGVRIYKCTFLFSQLSVYGQNRQGWLSEQNEMCQLETVINYLPSRLWTCLGIYSLIKFKRVVVEPIRCYQKTAGGFPTGVFYGEEDRKNLGFLFLWNPF